MSKFSIHPDSTKMYQDLKQNFWLSNMKVDIAKNVAECATCHQMKASHLKSAGVLQLLSIPMWKWDDISMDFIVGLPLIARKKDSSGLSWTDSPKPPISLQFILLIQCNNMQSYTWIK
jgi:hypothetical protein